MTLTAKGWGRIGSAVMFSLTIVLGLLAEVPAFDSATRHTSRAILGIWLYPVIQLWEWFLPRIGFGGGSGLLFAFPMLFSCLIYAGLMGFGLGYVASRSRGNSK